MGADGIDIDEHGHVYVANCGDAVIEKFTFNEAGKLTQREVITPPGQMKSADGIFFDRPTQCITKSDKPYTLSVIGK